MDKIRFPGSLHNHTDFSNFRLRDSINTVEGLMDRRLNGLCTRARTSSSSDYRT